VQDSVFIICLKQFFWAQHNSEGTKNIRGALRPNASRDYRPGTVAIGQNDLYVLPNLLICGEL